MSHDDLLPNAARLRVVIHGAVQGVGFRPFVFKLAQELGLGGWVNNSAAGVVVEAEGPEPVLRDFLRRLENEKPAITIVQSLETTLLDPVGFATFEIRKSTDGEKRTLVMPDLATCKGCLADIFDRGTRRFRYPFTNCTACGPRFSIIASLPYDRAATTMRKFTMCRECEREYNDPGNRRFHAQPNACPDCGPQLALWRANGAEIATRDQALLAAAAAIREGKIVAVKGLGGFHLMVDARNDEAVRALRARKRREEKPFALLAPSFVKTLHHCFASDVERRLLRSPESPIVLLRRRPEVKEIAPSVAPGNPNLGVMLPGNPLHHLLMHELGFPVVATSGNLSEEPICTDEQEALKRLAGIADLFLVHDRPILRHVDDAIVREMCGRELVLRRARGFAPLPVHVEPELPPVLAVGAHQKNTIAIAVGSDVFLSQHIGDLETEGAHHAFRATIRAFEDLYEFKPAAVACDLHPDYLSTQHAHSLDAPVIAVQHHLAHILACMAENQLQPPVLGIAWDGSGLGEDGTMWGGEFLRVTRDGCERVAHLRRFLLPGNERAVREPRRVALAVLYEIFGDQAIVIDAHPVRAFSPAELATLRTMLERWLNSPVTTSVGRLFDAFASLLGVRQVVSFEGQAAMELEYAVGNVADEAPLPYAIREEDGRFVLDWEPAVRAVLPEPSNPALPARFHNMLVAMAVDVAARVGEANIVLSGGCFQNRYLSERMVARLRVAGHRPYWHQRVPPNDGGIALGQVMAAHQRRDPADNVPGGTGRDPQH
ncbi:MAG: carbamoyltransferase HypF [Deltaproteobacteria bacterium]|nr:carbamoyltransferase HypF [Deltaproteobacteria bacterium]